MHYNPLWVDIYLFVISKNVTLSVDFFSRWDTESIYLNILKIHFSLTFCWNKNLLSLVLQTPILCRTLNYTVFVLDTDSYAICLGHWGILTLSLTLRVSITVRAACRAWNNLSPLMEADISSTTTTSLGVEVVVDT